MITRVVVALATGVSLWLPPTSARSVASDVELIADTSFTSAHDIAATAPWRCDDATGTATDGGPVIGAEFTQGVGERDGDTPGTVPTVVEVPHELLGTPTENRAAACIQVVPVEPGATYRLAVTVTGGPVVFGTEYGSVSRAESPRWDTLTTTFTVAANRRTVTVVIRGTPGAAPYYAWDASLVGRPSSVQRPAAPTGLRLDRHTSRTARLTWLAAPGATSYRVFRDGQPAATTSEPAALITGLTADATSRLTVTALNPAGESVGSAPLTMASLPSWNTVPDRPTGVTLADVNRPGGLRLELTAPARVTDGYQVYMDGNLVGWMYESPALLYAVPTGIHVITVTAVNAIGASVPSKPVIVTVSDNP